MNKDIEQAMIELGTALGALMPVFSQFPVTDKATAQDALKAVEFVSADAPPYAAACYKGLKTFLEHYIHSR